MTVSSSTSKSRYTGNGVTTAFTGSFRILDQSHVTVTHTSTVGVDTVKTITTDYTVSGVGGSSFTVTHLVAPASGVIVTLSRNVPATQELDLVENDAMPANDLETAFDKVTMLFQQAEEASDRAIRFPVSDSTSRTAELPVAALRAGKVVAFDADGDVIVSTEDLTDIEGSITAAAASATAAAVSAAAAATAETNAETAEAGAEAAQAAAEAAAASVPSFPIDPNDTTFAATKRVLGRDTAGAGTGEEVSLTQLLDWIGSAAQGDILLRGASGWERLAAAVAGRALQTGGASTNPAWTANTLAGFSVTTYASSSDLTTTIPYDDTIPQQSTEGTEIMSIAYACKSTTSRLVAIFFGFASGNASVVTMSSALFKDSTADAVAFDSQRATQTDAANKLGFIHTEVPGTVSSITWKVRVGPDAGTMRMNGTSGARRGGGVAKATFMILEFAG